MQNSNDIDQLINQNQRRFGKRSIIFIILFSLITAGLIFWYFYTDSLDDSLKISYEEHLVKKGTIADLMIASGSTNIENKINLSFNTSGTITSIFVEEGDQVTEGQLLAELDSKDLINNHERQKLQLQKLLDYPSDSDLKSAEYLVSQAEKNLKDLIDYPSDEQLKSAQELVSQSRANFITAQENYDKLLVPTDSQFDSVIKIIEQAEYTVDNTNLLISNAENTASSNKILLIESVNNYCDQSWDGLGLPNIGDACSGEENLPLSKSITDNILSEIFVCCDANTTKMNLSKSLINTNSNYLSSLEQIEVYKLQLESANANLKDAQNTLENLKNPTQNDIDRFAHLEDQAELNLQKSLNSLEEILLGTKQEDLDLAEENLSKAKSSLDKIKGGSDKNDIAVQRLLVSQADDNISKTKLYASFDGQISSINSKVGEFIGSGQNLMTLTDPETIEMEIIASEAEYVEMEEGMYGIVALDSKPESPLIIQVVSISDVPNVQQGVVTYPVRARFIRGFEVISLIDKFRPLIQSLIGGIDPSSLQNIPGGGFPGGGSFPGSGMGGRPNSNQNFDINNLDMNNPLLNFLSGELPAEGMNGTVTLLQESVENVLIIPSEAIIVERNVKKVISSYDDENDIFTQVETGLTDGSMTEITTGLNEGNKIYIKKESIIENSTSKSIDEVTNNRPGPPGPGGGAPRR